MFNFCFMKLNRVVNYGQRARKTHRAKPFFPLSGQFTKLQRRSLANKCRRIGALIQWKCVCCVCEPCVCAQCSVFTAKQTQSAHQFAEIGGKKCVVFIQFFSADSCVLRPRLVDEIKNWLYSAIVAISVDYKSHPSINVVVCPMWLSAAPDRDTVDCERPSSSLILRTLMTMCMAKELHHEAINSANPLSVVYIHVCLWTSRSAANETPAEFWRDKERHAKRNWVNVM